MSTRQLVESLVSSLAWPAAALVIALIYRPFLTRWFRERRSVAPELSGDPEPSPPFELVLAQTSQQMIEAGIVRPADATEAELHADEITRFASLSPPGTVVEGHTLIHKALQRLVFGPGPMPDGADAPTTVLSRSALNGALITEDLDSAIERLTFLRGLATNRGGGEVPELRALDYLMLVQAVICAIEQTRPSGG